MLKRLGAVAERVTVGHVGSTSRYYCDDGVLFLRTQNVGDGGLALDDVKRVTPEFHQKLKKSQVQAGDVLLSRVISDSIRVAVVPSGLGAVNCANIVLIRPGSRLHSGYLGYFIASPLAQQQLLRFRVGSAQTVVNTTVVKNWELPVPGLAEQRRLADILDRADAIRRKRRAAIGLTEELLRSAFLDMFGDPVTNPKGWPRRQLSELVRADDRINYGVVQPGKHDEDGVPLLRVGDFQSGTVSTETLKRITKRIESKYSRSRLRGDEIVIACVGSVGTTALVEATQRGFNIARAVARVPVDTRYAGRQFLLWYLRTPFVQHYFASETRTVAQPTLNIRQLKATPVYMPPLAVQHDFDAIARRVAELRGSLVAAADEADTLFHALTQRAFRGDL